MHRGRVSALVATIAIAIGGAAYGGAAALPVASAGPKPQTPIKHLVVIFQENISFDHYFGTYPNAANPAGEPTFTAKSNTPQVNNLLTAGLLTNNPNKGNPQRYARSEPLTCDQNHDYTPEQLAVDHGVADKFVENTGSGPTRAQCDISPVPPQGHSPNDFAVLDYYDGNTVTALWNYAQHFAMSDNSYSTTYGPSTEGALNVVSGQTYGVQCAGRASSFNSIANGNADAYPGTLSKCPGTGISTTGGDLGSALGTGTMTSDSDQYYDVCSNPKVTASMGGKNVGDLLSTSGTSWGWFTGGFQNQGYKPGDPSTSTVATTGCKSKHYNIGAGPALDGQVCTTTTPPGPNDKWCVTDYSAHHEPFQYYSSTSNATHKAPSAIDKIGTNADGANHQYDLADFWAAVDDGHMPAVSYLKAPKYADGHPGYSDPLDEQHFIVSTLNRLQKTDEWSSTAVVILYDDSDGWYDHVSPPVVMQSQTPTNAPAGMQAIDQLTGDGKCGSNPAKVPTTDTGSPELARCGYGPRQPLLIVSPFARENYVDHSITDQASVVRFIEDNWKLGRLGNGSADSFAGPLNGMFDFERDDHADKLFLNTSTGQPA